MALASRLAAPMYTAAFAAMLMAGAPASAGDTRPGGAEQRQVLLSEGFMAAHPDLRFRHEGVLALERGEPDHARELFRKAALHADKPSQAMLAELLWTGRGGPVDRPRGYAWMDIAAERGYPLFVAKREHYWSQLDAAGREAAVRVGAPLYDHYRDRVAKPRLERVLDRARRKATGSRVGSIGNMRIKIIGSNGRETIITGQNYYADAFWEPGAYWAWQDAEWSDPPAGSVDVRALEVVRDASGKATRATDEADAADR